MMDTADRNEYLELQADLCDTILEIRDEMISEAIRLKTVSDFEDVHNFMSSERLREAVEDQASELVSRFTGIYGREEYDELLEKFGGDICEERISELAEAALEPTEWDFV